MPSKIYSCALKGIDAYGVEIEVDVLRGLSRFIVVGLGDTAVQESKERVRSAIVNSGAQFPRQRKLVNLAPAHTKKCGPAFDVPIAVGLLVESGQIPVEAVQDALFVGELALNGTLRHVTGILAYALYAKEKGIRSLYVPEVDAQEALLISGINVYPVKTLKELIAHLNGEHPIEKAKRIRQTPLNHLSNRSLELEPIKGCEYAIRALAISSAGGHHVLLSGPPGSGKTLLAHYLPSLLPPLTESECIELTKIHSAAGLLSPARPFTRRRPFRSIHHTASASALVGGTSAVRPGEISLAHRGVLFLDEMPEFPRYLLEALRQPLEDKCVTIARASATITFPANFTLAGAMNPCPCGYFGDPIRKCSCTSNERRSYRKKLSGPLIDRIDLLISMRRLSFEQMQNDEPTIKITTLRSKILQARQLQYERFGSIQLNSDMSPQQVKMYCRVNEASQALLKDAMKHQFLTARGYHRVLKVARTIADLEERRSILKKDLLESLQYRLIPI